MKYQKTVFSLLFTLVAVFTFASEGRIPIYQQTTINQPGSYVVTRNISTPVGPAIFVQSDGVTIDLNNHTLESFDPAATVVELADGYTGLTLRKGAIRGGSWGVGAFGTIPSTMVLEDITISTSNSGGVEHQNAEYLEMRRCKVIGVSGFAVDAMPPPAQPLKARIVDCNFVSCMGGLMLTQPKGCEIRGNTVAECLGGPGGIYLFGGSQPGSNILSYNTVRNCSGDGIVLDTDNGFNILENNIVTENGGIGIRMDSEGNVLRGNLISRNAMDGVAALGLGCALERNTIRFNQNGIVSLGDDARIIDNHITNNLATGILIFGGMRALVDGNTTSGNGAFGVDFAGGVDHAYRNNMLRGNPTGPVNICCANATDEGGNIL